MMGSAWKVPVAILAQYVGMKPANATNRNAPAIHT